MGMEEACKTMCEKQVRAGQVKYLLSKNFSRSKEQHKQFPTPPKKTLKTLKL